MMTATARTAGYTTTVENYTIQRQHAQRAIQLRQKTTATARIAGYTTTTEFDTRFGSVRLHDWQFRFQGRQHSISAFQRGKPACQQQRFSFNNQNVLTSAPTERWRKPSQRFSTGYIGTQNVLTSAPTERWRKPSQRFSTGYT